MKKRGSYRYRHLAKRGFSGFDVIASLVIGLLIVAILSALFPNLLFGWFKQYKNITQEVTTPATMNFTPFSPVLSEEQQRMETSLGLLVTGIDSVASGKEVNPDFIKSNQCTDQRQDLCIICNQDPLNKLQCSVKGFELPQRITDAQDWITGYGDPQYLLYYEKFPPGEEKTWQFEASKLATAGIVLQGVFSVLPFTSALKSFSLNRVNRFMKTLERVEETTDPTRRAKLVKTLMEQADTLKEAGKLDESLEALMKVVVANDKAFMKTLSAEVVADEFANKVYLRIMDKFRQQADGSIYIADKTLLEQEIKTITEELGLPLAKADELTKDLVDITEHGGINSVDDIKKILRDYDLDALGLKKFAAVGPGSELGKSALRKVGFKKIVSAMVKEGTVAKQLEESYAGLKTLQKTNPDLYGRIVRDVDAFVHNEFLERQIIDGVEVITPRFDKLGVAKSDAIGRLLKAAEEQPEAIEGIADLFSRESLTRYAQRYAKKAGELAFGPAPGATIPGKAVGFLKEKAKVSGCLAALATVPTGAVVSLASLGVALPAAVKVNKAVLGPCGSFIKGNYLPLLFALGYYAKKIDSQNQKFIPVGENALSLLKPLEEGPTLQRGLVDADGYFVATTRDASQKPTRFFLASPCKVDMAITNRYCKGKVQEGDYVLMYKNKYGQEIHQPIEPVSLDKSKIRKYYSWDTWNDERRVAFLNGRNQGDPWYSRLMKDGSDEVFYKLVNSPEDLKIALKFVYNAYPNADKSAFFEVLRSTTINVGKHSGGASPFSAVCQADIPHFLDEQDQRTPTMPAYSVRGWNSFTASFAEEVRLALGGEEIDNNCFKSFIDALVDFSLEHPYGDAEPFTFSCSATGKTVTMKGAYARHYLNSLIGRFDAEHEADKYGNTCGATRAESQRGFIFNRGVAKTVTSSAYQEWLTHHQRTEDWQRFKSWDMWESYGFSLGSFPPRDVFIYKSGFFDSIAREAAYNLNYVNKADVDALKNKPGHFDPVVKTLNLEDTQVVTQAPTPASRWVSETLEVTVPCITLTPEMSAYTQWNDGNNYCYTGRNAALEVADTALMSLSIAGGLALTVLSEGAAAPYVVYLVGATDVTSFTTMLILEKCGSWPRHEADLKGCLT